LKRAISKISIKDNEMTYNKQKPRTMSEAIVLKVKIINELIRSVKNPSVRKRKNKELRRLAEKTGLEIEFVEEGIKSR
tara:strand:+ start:5600 stop:5833 length:234 start_codon:yes stop_codon:yes gene_type:complete